MEIEFDPAKNERNFVLRGISFEAVDRFLWNTAMVWEDGRKDYKEARVCALGFIDDRLYHLTFTMRDEIVRVISLRRANLREHRKYKVNAK